MQMLAKTDQKTQYSMDLSDLNAGLHEHVASEKNIKSTIARLLLEKLENECRSYCILTGYEELPRNFDSDIDFMVGTHDFERIPALINEIATESNTLLFQSITHEASGRAFRLAAEVGDCAAFIQPDSCADYRHYGKLWLKADEILADRRVHSNGFWIPGAADEFIYYLIKRLNKKDFQGIHGEKLTKLYLQDPGKCISQLERFWKLNSVKKLEAMARTGNWASLIDNLIQFRQELWRAASQKRAIQFTSYIRSCSHTIERIFQATGASIAFIGPDGCGKSSVIEAIEREFKPAYQQVVRFHLRPKSLPARNSSSAVVTDPHGKPAKGTWVSIAKMLYLAFDYWVGYCLKVRNNMVRTRLVIFDRYFDDIIVDPRRVLYGGPKWIVRLLGKCLPRPEITFLLDASPEVLWARKREVAFNEVVRQQQAFLELAKNDSRIKVIDASQPLQNVVRDIRKTILTHFSIRTKKRLGLL